KTKGFVIELSSMRCEHHQAFVFLWFVHSGRCASARRTAPPRLTNATVEIVRSVWERATGEQSDQQGLQSTPHRVVIQEGRIILLPSTRKGLRLSVWPIFVGILTADENQNSCEQRNDSADDGRNRQRPQCAKTREDQPDGKQQHSRAAGHSKNGHVSTSA